MKKLLIIALAAGAVWAQKVEVESDESIDFTRFKTFAIREGRLNSKNPALNSELVRKKIDAEIRKSFEAKKLAFVESGAADLNVRYTLGSARRLERDVYPAGWRGLRRRVVVEPYTEGTLVIDLRDGTARSLIWRAIASEDEKNASKLEDKLDDMVRKAIDKYPPKK